MRTLLFNGRIHSPWAPDASALLVDGADVAWLGDDASAGTMTADRRVDLEGALVIPAFVDSHFHATGTGLSLTGLDLSDAASLAVALSRVERLARSSGGRPLLGSGWDETNWPEGRPPTAAELDRASYGGVVYLARTDAHSAVASSALMASIPSLSKLDGYSRDGLLTKEAHHAARELALAAINPAQRHALQRVALERAASCGIAAVHEMAGPEISSADDLTALLALSREEVVPEVFGYWGELGGTENALSLGAVGAGGDLFCDGSIGSHTAGLSEPYLDSDTTGYLRFDTAELADHIVACTEAGLQAGFHAIGDAAVGQVVAAMDQAAQSLAPGRVTGAGHRIEHVELIPDIAALARTGLLASVQPAFDATWGRVGGMYEARLGAQRAATMNPFAELAAAGVPLALGSDSPVTSIDPWGAVRAAIYPSNPKHALSARAAFGAHTRGGWRAARADSDGSGVLAPGNPATYAVFSAGPLGVDTPDDRLSRWSTDERGAVPGLPDLSPGVELPRCLRTVRRGVQIYDSGDLA
ncbi:amidohydrolase [Jatrophihabitans sp. DSM 45814]